MRNSRSSKEGAPHPQFTLWQKVALLAAFALLLVLRLPGAWAHGRFQAEEGTVFLAYAWHFPWPDALLRPFGGYLNLGANVSAILAAQLARSGVLPLERAPYLTMGIALVFQLVPGVLILTGKAQWLTRRLAVIAALLAVALAQASQEVFYNTLHIQFHLTLAVALILALDVPERRATRIAYCALLLFAPLCGPGAIVILPLLGLRALIDRDRGRWVQFTALAAGAATQLLLFFGSSPFRSHPVASTIAVAMLVRLILLPVFGMGLTNGAANAIVDSQPLAWAAVLASVALFGGLVVVSARRGGSAVWLVLAAICLAVVSTGFGIFGIHARDMFDVMVGGRYDFVPRVLIVLSVIAVAMRRGPPSPVGIALTALILINGALDYRRSAPEWTHGPDWAAEVRAWRANHDYQPAAWPRWFTVDLSDRSRPCSPSSAKTVPANEPGYCESAWVGQFVNIDERTRRERIREIESGQ